MLLKKRHAKMSQRGVYLQDSQLQQTQFQPGTSFTYVVDVTNQNIVILPSAEGTNTVSKRTIGYETKPVIDIRSKEAREAFRGCEYLQVEIHDDQVVVTGFVGASASSSVDAIRKHEGTRSSIRRISDFLEVRQTARIVFQKDQFEKVVGSYEQLRLFSFAELDGVSSEANRATQQALGNLYIPLEINSLFSGAGFMDKGFQDAGFRVTFAVERDADAVLSYRHNIGTHIVESDIREVKTDAFRSPVMIGGTPCQGMSNANRRTNFLDNPNNILVRSYIDAVKSNPNCQVFILENVPHILNTSFKKEIMSELRDFEIESGILNAADFGAPQLRERAIFIGSKIGRIFLPRRRVFQHQTVREAFDRLDDTVPNQTDVSLHNPLTLQRIQSVPSGGNVHDIPSSIRPKGCHSDMYKRLEWDRPSITIVNPRKAMLLHPEEHRVLSVRECARLQGVSDTFRFFGKLGSRQQQVANGVPLQLARAVADVVRVAIEQFNIRARPKFASAW